MKSLTSRIEDLEYTAAADLVGDYLLLTHDEGETYTDRNGTYTRAEVEQLGARGARITIIDIRRVAMTPTPEDVSLISSLPNNGQY